MIIVSHSLFIYMYYMYIYTRQIYVGLWYLLSLHFLQIKNVRISTLRYISKCSENNMVGDWLYITQVCTTIYMPDLKIFLLWRCMYISFHLKMPSGHVNIKSCIPIKPALERLNTVKICPLQTYPIGLDTVQFVGVCTDRYNKSRHG